MPEAAGLYYEIHGPEDGDWLVLSAGLGGTGSYWRPNLPALSEHFRVLVYDHRGTGRSDRTLSTVDLSGDVAQLMDALEIREAHFIGHAAGGIAGLQMALDWPHRLKRLVVVNGWIRPDAHFARCFETRLTLLRDSGVSAYVRAQPIFLYPAEWSSRHSVALDSEADEMITHFQAPEVLDRRVEMLMKFDITDNLDNIDIPILALAAADDLLVPAFRSQELVEGIATAMLATMPWGGHACNVTDPDTFNRLVLDFLGK